MFFITKTTVISMCNNNYATLNSFCYVYFIAYCYHFHMLRHDCILNNTQNLANLRLSLFSKNSNNSKDWRIYTSSSTLKFVSIQIWFLFRTQTWLIIWYILVSQKIYVTKKIWWMICLMGVKIYKKVIHIQTIN